MWQLYKIYIKVAVIMLLAAINRISFVFVHIVVQASLGSHSCSKDKSSSSTAIITTAR